MLRFFAALVLSVAASAAALAHPNVVVVTADDMTLADLEVMPKTLALIADEGVTFDHAFAAHGLCGPSRATFLTGQYNHNHGVLENKEPNGGYWALDHGDTLPVWMQSAGFYTGFIGKYLNGLGRDTPWDTQPPGWDDWQALITNYKMYRWTMNDNGTWIKGNATQDLYQTDEIADRAEAFILGRTGNPQPFFLTVAPTVPHKESNMPGAANRTIRPADRHDGLFDNVPLPKPPNWNEDDVSDKPNWIDKLPNITANIEEQIETRYQDRREALQSLDDLVEKTVQALEVTGKLDDTLIVFWSDNGYFFGEHRIPDNKNEIYEEAARVPLLMRGPGIPAGVIDSQRVSNIDIAPTIVAMTGAVPGRVMDGIDLVAALSSPNPDRPLLINAYHGDAYTNAVRVNGWIWADHDRSTDELYDLSGDPYQLDNLVDDPVYDAMKANLDAKLTTLRTCSGATCN